MNCIYIPYEYVQHDAVPQQFNNFHDALQFCLRYIQPLVICKCHIWQNISSVPRVHVNKWSSTNLKEKHDARINVSCDCCNQSNNTWCSALSAWMYLSTALSTMLLDEKWRRNNNARDRIDTTEFRNDWCLPSAIPPIFVKFLHPDFVKRFTYILNFAVIRCRDIFYSNLLACSISFKKKLNFSYQMSAFIYILEYELSCWSLHYFIIVYILD